MAKAALIERVENPLVRTFLQEHLDEFVGDVIIFAEHVLAHVPSDSKSFVKSAGLAFYSTPIVCLVPDLPWQTIKTAIANAVSDVFQTKSSDHAYLENRLSDVPDKNHAEGELIEQAIIAAFASACESAEGAVGTILIGGVAHLLGKYIALHIAGNLDEVIERRTWPY
jgi:hypothetical protein